LQHYRLLLAARRFCVAALVCLMLGFASAAQPTGGGVKVAGGASAVQWQHHHQPVNANTVINLQSWHRYE
jgi:hypothetical protein